MPYYVSSRNACYETLLLPLHIFKHTLTANLKSVYLNIFPQRNTGRPEVKFCAIA